MSGSVRDRVERHAAALESAAAAMEAQGVGLHPTRGHVHVARHLAADLRAAAARGQVAHEFPSPASLHAAAAIDGGMVEGALRRVFSNTTIASMEAAGFRPDVRQNLGD